jgi:hypothetical protein
MKTWRAVVCAHDFDICPTNAVTPDACAQRFGRSFFGRKARGQ